jgi:DNA-directed RNA polymerase specialized sigma24 family protein
LQEGGASFQTTHWTVVLQASKADSDESTRKAFATFADGYWPPLYTFLRRRGYSSADAQDLVQGFFAYLLEHDTLSRADREKGRLRTFLLASLQNFILDERGRVHALKRGGGCQIVSLDRDVAEAEAAILASADVNDTKSFDVTWAFTIAKLSWLELRKNLVAEGKARWLDELKPFVAGATPANQEEVAARLGVPITTLRTWLSRLRQRYRDLLPTEVANTVSDPADVDEELRYLLRVLTL